jgi:SAM-dependent methyltransferase
VPPTPARHPAVSESESLDTYWTFYWAVAAAQLARWLPVRPARILDISGHQARRSPQVAVAGHSVIQVVGPRSRGKIGARGETRGTGRDNGGTGAGGDGAGGDTAGPGGDTAGPGGRTGGEDGTGGRVHHVVGDVTALRFLAGGSVDGVLAEGRMLSRHLATEAVVAEIARVLRPGGRVLLSVDSLVFGMAILAEQNYWAHLSDVPRAEVVLVPWPDGTITRCFGTEQLRELLAGAGLEVEWVRPRTALSPTTVEHVLTTDPQALPRLVRAELTATPTDESVGIHLVASARRP